LDKQLVPKATGGDAKVFFLKMKGDYCRYIAEYATVDLHKKVSDNAL